MNKVIFIADFFADEVPGGGELNNQQLIQILQKRGVDVLEIKSQNVSPQFLQEQDKNTKFKTLNLGNYSSREDIEEE